MSNFFEDHLFFSFILFVIAFLLAFIGANAAKSLTTFFVNTFLMVFTSASFVYMLYA